VLRKSFLKDGQYFDTGALTRWSTSTGGESRETRSNRPGPLHMRALFANHPASPRTVRRHLTNVVRTFRSAPRAGLKPAYVWFFATCLKPSNSRGDSARRSVQTAFIGQHPSRAACSAGVSIEVVAATATSAVGSHQRLLRPRSACTEVRSRYGRFSCSHHAPHRSGV